MRDEIADVVFPVFRYGLQLRKRLLGRRADELDLEKEQSELRGLIQATAKSGERELIGDGSTGDVMKSYSQTSRSEGYLGIRYALACWIDEIMIQEDMPWNEAWNENKLETHLFQLTLRSEKFWEQARRAANRQTRDGLEVFYLCVVLGFRGMYVDQPERVQAWREQWETQINEGRSYTPPLEQKVISRHEPLDGAKRKQRMLLAATVTGLTAIVFGVIAAFLAFSK